MLTDASVALSMCEHLKAFRITFENYHVENYHLFLPCDRLCLFCALEQKGGDFEIEDE